MELDAVRARLGEDRAAAEAALVSEMEERYLRDHTAAIEAATEAHASELSEASVRSEAVHAELSAEHEAALGTASAAAQQDRESLESELASATAAKESAVGALETELASVREDHA